MPAITRIQRLQRLAVIVLMFLGAGNTARADAVPPYVIQMKLVPKTLYASAPSELIVGIKGGALGGLRLTLRATNGFQVSPTTFQWPVGDARSVFVVAANVANRSTIPSGTGSIVATLSRVAGDETLVSEIFDFDYQPTLQFFTYLLVGAAGIAIGYLLRMAIKALSETQPDTALALAAVPSPVGLRKFVLKHYYLVDFAVTLVLGLLVLISLMKDGRVPANAAFWYSAMVLGVGLGLLTNSELLTRIK